jgi:hypothetical protein
MVVEFSRGVGLEEVVVGWGGRSYQIVESGQSRLRPHNSGIDVDSLDF